MRHQGLPDQAISYLESLPLPSSLDHIPLMNTIDKKVTRACKGCQRARSAEAECLISLAKMALDLNQHGLLVGVARDCASLVEATQKAYNHGNCDTVSAMESDSALWGSESSRLAELQEHIKTTQLPTIPYNEATRRRFMTDMLENSLKAFSEITKEEDFDKAVRMMKDIHTGLSSLSLPVEG